MKNRISRLLGVALAVSTLAFGALAHEFKLGDIEIGHPYARAMLPGAKVGGGYMTLVNTGTTADRLVSVTAERAASAELHEMKIDNGVMIMRELASGVPVPAGATVELKPGGYHIMFMNVSAPFKEGEMIKARLTFEKAGTVDVEFAVGPAAGEARHDTHGDAHKEHGK